jgi:hypothetical protein
VRANESAQPHSVTYDPSVLLRGATGRKFGLEIEGYELPAIKDRQLDSNWLNITIHVSNEQSSWTATHPSLLTWDIERLAIWLEAIVEERAAAREIHFDEPNLKFGLLDLTRDTVNLRLWLELESRPTWASSHVVDEQFWVDLDVNREDARLAPRSLRTQLQEFPPRAASE